MKKLTIIFVFAILMLSTMACAKESKSNSKWDTNLENAIKIASAQNKSILVDFTGSDWCVWCHRLDNEVFSKKEFSDWADKNLVLVKLDFPRNIKQSKETKLYNRNLARKYEIKGFPTILVLDSKGKLLEKTGYLPGGPLKYIESLKRIIKK